MLSCCETIRPLNPLSAKIRVVKMNRSPADPPSIEFCMRSPDAKLRNPLTMYDFCEAEGLLYAFGFGTNETLKHRVSELELVENTKLF